MERVKVNRTSGWQDWRATRNTTYGASCSSPSLRALIRKDIFLRKRQVLRAAGNKQLEQNCRAFLTSLHDAVCASKVGRNISPGRSIPRELKAASRAAHAESYSVLSANDRAINRPSIPGISKDDTTEHRWILTWCAVGLANRTQTGNCTNKISYADCYC